ncbi:gtpase-activating rap/ran-gap domain-like protein [Anaeramoeba flamelloides]|uniref:Gtpase-activating rap/ran-gap domain-like protein n=1 Tax=Anaeramoeba flamelloides TaxID=1746091 RepID=A0ABQ8X3F0_9EUKA|nr:gtpase-activating rap/ran-gap domain-like protein [Anaeramoeba flamelloides]
MNELEKVLNKQILDFGEFSEECLDLQKPYNDPIQTTNNSLFELDENWKIEPFNEKQEEINLNIFLDNKIFSENFLNKDYYCLTVCLSIHDYFLFTILEKEETEEIYILCCSSSSSKMKIIKESDLKYSFLRKIFCLGPPMSAYVSAFDPQFESATVVSCSGDLEEKDLIQMENLEIPLNYKFGILYVEEGQNTQEDYLTNVEHSEEFEDFLNILGDKITLFGWKKYRGGLDVNHGTSGETSIYTEWNDFSIMFHVLTLIPYIEKDDQQVTRKKHIGNDVVVIVFLNGDIVYNPNSFRSKQNHILIAVRPLKDGNETKYQLEVNMKNCVRHYEPFLPIPPILDQDEIRDYILTKACQGERIASKSGKFWDRFQNFRADLLEEVWERY